MAPCLAHKHFRFTLFATLTDVYIQSLPLPQETHNSFEMGKSFIHTYIYIYIYIYIYMPKSYYNMYAFPYLQCMKLYGEYN
jgi:hypothetical protein